MSKHHRVGTHTCPFCDMESDSATGVNRETAPIEGDVSVCLYCGNWAVFTFPDGVLAVRKPTATEVADAKGTDVDRVCAAVRQQLARAN